MARSRGIDRRQFVLGGALAPLALASCSRGTQETPAPAPTEPAPPTEPTVVRVASVKTAVDGSVLPTLIDRFEHASPYRVRLTTGTQVYDAAREGQIDLVVSHYGHHDAEAFVLDGLGEWPRTIFINQIALLGPARDPAKVRGLADLGEAFTRIAQTRSTFVMNDIDGVHYLTEILWNAAGKARPHRLDGGRSSIQGRRDRARLGARRVRAVGADSILAARWVQLPLALSNRSCLRIRSCNGCSCRSSSSRAACVASIRPARTRSRPSCCLLPRRLRSGPSTIRASRS